MGPPYRIAVRMLAALSVACGTLADGDDGVSTAARSAGDQQETSRPARSAASMLPKAVSWTNPPTPDELVPTGTEKFIILAREPRPGDWNFMASAWEYIPNRPTMPITCRVRFEPSHWSPGLLCWREPGECPEFVRLQVHYANARPGYRTNLYEVDYRTWRVITRLRSHWIDALGATGERIFLSVSGEMGKPHELRILNRLTGKIEVPSRPFQKRYDFEDLWLVKFADTGAESLDFFYGDLGAQELRRVKSPSEALARANDMEICCVRAP